MAVNRACSLTACAGNEMAKGFTREKRPGAGRSRVTAPSKSPARLAAHARQRTLALSPDWPWTGAFITCWNRLHALTAPA